MDTITAPKPGAELVSAVADLRHVPLSELVRARVAQLDRGAGQAEQGLDGEFNSSI